MRPFESWLDPLRKHFRAFSIPGATANWLPRSFEEFELRRRVEDMSVSPGRMYKRCWNSRCRVLVNGLSIKCFGKCQGTQRTMWKVKYEPIGGGGILNGLYQRIALSTPRRTGWKIRERQDTRLNVTSYLRPALNADLSCYLLRRVFPKRSKSRHG